MKLVLWDIIKADVYTGQVLQKGLKENDTLVNQQYQQVIFDHYHISRDQFLRNYSYYYNNQELMTALFDSTTAMRQKPSFVPFKNQ